MLVNVVSASAYKMLFHDYSLTQLGSVQVNLKVYISTSMSVIGLCMLCHLAHDSTTQVLSFNVTDIEGSVLLNCTDTSTLGLVLASYKLNRKISSSAKLVTRKTQRNNAKQPISKQPQLSTDNQATVHI